MHWFEGLYFQNVQEVYREGECVWDHAVKVLGPEGNKEPGTQAYTRRNQSKLV